MLIVKDPCAPEDPPLTWKGTLLVPTVVSVPDPAIVPLHTNEFIVLLPCPIVVVPLLTVNVAPLFTVRLSIVVVEIELTVLLIISIGAIAMLLPPSKVFPVPVIVT